MEKYIDMLEDGQDLDGEAYSAMRCLLSDDTSEKDIFDFLDAMNKRMEEKPVSISEIRGFVVGMNKDSRIVDLGQDRLLDICGTGGGIRTANVSTMAAIIAATAGVNIAKHGNCSNSGCGSADILDQFGYNLDMDPSNYKKLVDETNFVFLYAQKCYPTMAKVARVRKEMGGKTIFNLLGPLLNPANASHRLIGVNDKSLCKLFSEILNPFVERAMVVYGSDPEGRILDEISNVGETVIYEVDELGIRDGIIEPEVYGIERSSIDQIIIDPDYNMHWVDKVLKDEEGPIYDLILLNAGFAIALGKDLPIEFGLREAEDILESKSAYDHLLKICFESRKC